MAPSAITELADVAEAGSRRPSSELGSPHGSGSHVSSRAARGSCKLFVGGISARTTTEVLRTHFSKYGRLVDAVVMSKNGRPRGFGFVTYDTPAPTVRVLAEQQWLDGRLVDVKRAVPDERIAQERLASKASCFSEDAEEMNAYLAAYGGGVAESPFGFFGRNALEQAFATSGYLPDALCQAGYTGGLGPIDAAAMAACLATNAPGQPRSRGGRRRAKRSSDMAWMGQAGLLDTSSAEDSPSDLSPRSVALPRAAVGPAPAPPPGLEGLDSTPMKVEPAWLQSADWVC